MQHIGELKEIRDQLKKKVSEFEEILKNSLTQMDLRKAFLAPTEEGG